MYLTKLDKLLHVFFSSMNLIPLEVLEVVAEIAPVLVIELLIKSLLRWMVLEPRRTFSLLELPTDQKFSMKLFSDQVVLIPYFIFHSQILMLELVFSKLSQERPQLPRTLTLNISPKLLMVSQVLIWPKFVKLLLNALLENLLNMKLELKLLKNSIQMKILKWTLILFQKLKDNISKNLCWLLENLLVALILKNMKCLKENLIRHTENKEMDNNNKDKVL